MKKYALLACLMLAVACADGGKTTENGNSLQAQINNYTETVGRKENPALHAAFDRLADSLAASGIMNRALHTRERVPFFGLPDASGQQVKLADLLKQGPVVLTWYRGSWCPYCNLYLAALEEWVPKFKAQGAQLVAISVQTPDSSLSIQQRHRLSYHILSDTGGVVARSFGVVYTVPHEIIEHWRAEGRAELAAYNGNTRNELPLSATYIIKSDGTVAYAFLDKDHRQRLEPAYILKELEKLKQGS